MNLLSTALDSLSRDSLARHIFGEASRRAVQGVADSGQGSVVELTEMPLYQFLVLICLVFYFAWIYGHINRRGFKSFVGTGSAFTKSSEHGVHTGSGSHRVGDFILLWVLILGIYVLFLTKFLEVVDGVSFNYFSNILGGFSFTQHIERSGLGLWMLVVVVGFFLSIAWSAAMLYIADKISRKQSMLIAVFELRSKMLLYSVIYLMPCILLCSFGSYDSLRFYLALIMVLIFTVIYLIRSFLLFQSKKISILLWILYLCGVEIFPATLVWALFVRS
ncbi:MAG: DUF4271 domain-containing protein [Rikenellaceae bacterium]